MKFHNSEQYDADYIIGEKKISCYSPKKIKKLHPDGNYRIVGETILKNKKKKLDTIELGGKKMRVSEEGSHSRLLYRHAGYIREEESGDYLALLQLRWVLIWILLGIAVAGITAVLLTLPLKNEKGILPPDYELVTDDPNAVEEDVGEEMPEDRVILRLPKGGVTFEMKSDIGIRAGETGEVELTLTVDGTDYVVLKDTFTADGDGMLPGLQIDFTQVHVELKAGFYSGVIRITSSDGTETKLPILFVIRNTIGGSARLEYSDKAAVNLGTGEITIKYKHDIDASHDCVLQLILDNGGEEYLLAQSGALHPGQSLAAMTLADGMAQKLTTGVYHGRLRVNFFNGENELTNINTDIEVTITVQ